MAHKAWESVQKSNIVNYFATCGFVERHDILITEIVCIEDSDEWLILKNHFNLIEQFDDFVNFDDNIALLDLLPVMTLLVVSRNYKIMESKIKGN